MLYVSIEMKINKIQICLQKYQSPKSHANRYTFKTCTFKNHKAWFLPERLSYSYSLLRSIISILNDVNDHAVSGSRVLDLGLHVLSTAFSSPWVLYPEVLGSGVLCPRSWLLISDYS